ncbi:hypothetical protein [Prevotella jejuni]|uniref:hypothetical protein n=1 Tax=Prevotella jejuni TaxID=1177574 RepID=UPI00352CB7B6
MKKKDYVKPNAQVLILYTDEFMEGGFHAGSNIHGSLDAGAPNGEHDDDPDPSNAIGITEPEP